MRKLDGVTRTMSCCEKTQKLSYLPECQPRTQIKGIWGTSFSKGDSQPELTVEKEEEGGVQQNH